MSHHVSLFSSSHSTVFLSSFRQLPHHCFTLYQRLLFVCVCKFFAILSEFENFEWSQYLVYQYPLNGWNLTVTVLTNYGKATSAVSSTQCSARRFSNPSVLRIFPQTVLKIIEASVVAFCAVVKLVSLHVRFAKIMTQILPLFFSPNLSYMFHLFTTSMKYPLNW